jgi:hypothetical protein
MLLVTTIKVRYISGYGDMGIWGYGNGLFVQLAISLSPFDMSRENLNEAIVVEEQDTDSLSQNSGKERARETPKKRGCFGRFYSWFVAPQTDDMNLRDAVTSRIVSPEVLFSIRLFCLLYSATVYISNYVADSIRSPEYAYRINVYFTHISYLGLVLYFLVTLFYFSTFLP